MRPSALQPLRLDLAGTHLIEASAGTGKTYTIATLYLRLLLELRLTVDQILVVTFTRAATAELRDRVRRRLRELLEALQRPASAIGEGADETLQELVALRRAAGQLDDDRRTLQAALRSFDEAAIFTIHGFCQRMLQEHAFESGVELGTELLADQTALIAGCVHDFWARRMYALPVAVTDYLALANAERRERLGDEAPPAPRKPRGKADKAAAGQGEPAQREAEPAVELTELTRSSLTKLAQRVLASPTAQLVPASVEPPKALTRARDLEHYLRWLQHDFVLSLRAALDRRKEEQGVQCFDDLLLSLREALAGAGGEVLAKAVAKKFKAALIDEFQDTDPVQYAIFRTLLHAQQVPLFLIGDPKQAIYSFRGADVFAYLEAVHDAGRERHTLDTNQRSDGPLVEGVNTLFAAIAQPFVLDDIGFTKVAARHQAARLVLPGVGERPLQILWAPLEPFAGARGFITKDNIGRALPRLVAAHLANFLASSATIEGQPVQPGQVAVLCRNNRQAAAMQEALREVGVPSVLQGDSSVFDSAEADDLERLAWALCEPDAAGRLKAAITTATFGVGVAELCRLQADATAWNGLAQQFRAWHALWERLGFLPAFRRMLAEAGLEARLLTFGDGERALTNLLHLAELMQGAATAHHLGPAGLCTWLHRLRLDQEARADLGGEAAQLRLESDARAVQLCTVHRSKGLEYPVVYLPDLWESAVLRKGDATWVKFHDEGDGHRLKLDLCSDAKPASRAQAELESQAEHQRLLYVALTRARHRCLVVWGAFFHGGASPLAYSFNQAPGATGAETMARTRRQFEAQAGDDSALLAEVQGWAARAPASIGVTELEPNARPKPYQPRTMGPATLAARRLAGRLPSGWRTASFSALKAAAMHELHPAAEAFDLDEGVPAHRTAPAAPLATKPVLLGADQRGPDFGTFLHRLFEGLDFPRASEAQVLQLMATLEPRRAFLPGQRERLARAVVQAIDTPLPHVATGFKLRDLQRSQRRDELGFHFPVLAHAGAQHGLVAASLAAPFLAHGPTPALRAYGERLARLGFPPLTGFMKGSMDLIFEHHGRWYLVDYKSNDLGGVLGDYAPARLDEAMAQHHYHLQAYLYAVALRRHLRQRLPSFDAATQLGGVLYLFVRGMDPAVPVGNGVHFDRPALALLDALDEVMGQAEAGAQHG